MAALPCAALLLAAALAAAAATADSQCQIFVQRGGSARLPLEHQLQSGETLVWKHGRQTIYRDKAAVSPLWKVDVTTDGSLTLKEADTRHAGLYSVQVHRSNGQAVPNLKSSRLCVMNAVATPTLQFTCDSPSVTFTCNTTEEKIVWLQEEQEIPGQVSSVLTRSIEELRAGAIRCRVSNPVSQASSAALEPSCPRDEQEQLLGLEFWTMIAILSAGGGLVLLLFVILIVCCVCAGRKKSRRSKAEEELRLTWANGEGPKGPNQQEAPACQNQSRPRPARTQHRSAGNTGPRPQSSKNNGPETPKEPKAQPRRHAKTPRQPSREQLPPIPQPRPGARPLRA